MRVLLTVCTIALLAAASAVNEEDSFVEAQQSIQDMKKKGATEADCKDLAKTTCKEVLGEVRKDQKVIDSQSSGIHCNKLGGGAVTVAIRHYQTRVAQWKVSKKKIVTASNTKVTIASQSYKSLRSGKCGWVFSSRSYRTARSIYTRAVRYELTVRGQVTETKRQLTVAKRNQRIQQEKCRCNVKKRRDTIWRTINNAKKRARQLKALQKCKMMQCVLAGTSLKSSKCRAHLPALRNKKLYYKVEKISTRVCAAHHRENHVKVTGERKSKAKARERKQKENSSKEKKKKAIAREKAGKVRREQSAKAKAKEQQGKHHERRSKAAERVSKERSGKIERNNKYKAKIAYWKKQRVRAVHSWWWHGDLNGWDGPMNWHTSQITAGYRTYINGLQSHYNGHRKDRIFKPRLTKIGARQQHRALSGYVNNYDGTFTYTCPHNKVMVGLFSHHHNGNEDRRWRFWCAAFEGVGFRAGSWGGWKTKMRQGWGLTCSNNEPVIGFSSYHDNRKEDRVWRIRCGHRYVTPCSSCAHLPLNGN
jgi:hypothetical protein